MYKCTTVSIKRKTSAAMNLTSEDDLLAFFRQNDASLQCLNWCDIDFLARQVAEGTCRSNSKNVPNSSQTHPKLINFSKILKIWQLNFWRFSTSFQSFPNFQWIALWCTRSRPTIHVGAKHIVGALSTVKRLRFYSKSSSIPWNWIMKVYEV